MTRGFWTGIFFSAALIGAGGGARLATNEPVGNYRTAAAWPEVPVASPVQIVFAPGETHRLFVVERAGRIIVMRDRAHPTREVLLDITDRVGSTAGDTGLISMAFHPQFAQNGHIFLLYSVANDGDPRLRLGRFTVDDPVNGIARPDSEVPLISRPTTPNSHDGGQVAFGPDGYLYLSIGDGDAHSNPATAAHRQRLDHDFYGVVIRIDVDQKASNLPPHPHPSVHPGTYRIPADNPFVGFTTYHGQALVPTQVRTEFFAVGLRNPFRLSFDARDGSLWVADVGLDSAEELNLISAGANYGWPWREGEVAGPEPMPSGIPTVLTDPTWAYAHTGQRSLTGGEVYRGTKFPELNGGYLAADLVTGQIFALFNLASGAPRPVESVTLGTDDWIVNFTTDPLTGDILIADLLSLTLKRLERTAPAGGLVNLSSRALVGSGDQVLVPSFVINGGPKRVLIRAIGPTLGAPPFNVAGVIGAPAIALVRDGEELATNAGWASAPNAAAIRIAAATAGAFPLSPDHPDAALLATLESGAYSVVLRDATGAAGVGLVEVYDLDAPPSPARMVNLAVRATAGSGDQALTAGFVLTGPTPRTVLVRAIGPGLAEFQITGVLPDPVLAVYRADEKLAENQGWTTHTTPGRLIEQAQELGAFALQATRPDSALLLTLAPGVYTAQAVSATVETGIVLLEVYLVP